MSDTQDFLPLDASDLDNYLGQPLPVHQLREPVAINDIRRWVQGMHYPNPLHFDPDYAAESRWGVIVAPQSFVASTEIALSMATQTGQVMAKAVGEVELPLE